MKKIFILSSLIAVTLATPSFATPTELDKKTVASKAYVDTKQDKITTGLVEFDDQGVIATVPALVVTNSTGTALNGNTIGFLDLETYNNLNAQFDELPDTLVPSIGLIDEQLQNIWNDMTALTWNSAETTSTNAYETKFVGDTGATANAWPSADRSKLINTAALAQGLALKQNKIETGLVEFYNAPDDDTYNVPSLVSYGTGTNNTDGVLGNKIGIVDFEHIGADLKSFSYDGMDNFVPTVRAVASAITPLSWSGVQSTAINAYNTHFGNGTNQWAGFSYHLINGQFLANSLALKQNKLPAISTGNAAPTGNQAIVLSTAGYPSNVYTTAGKDLALTAKSGAQKVMNYIDGTTASATFATSQGLTEAQVKSALVSLELLKDVYGELNAKITNNALPTGTTGTVVTYNGTNATTGVQEFGERAVYDPANTYNASTDATKLATMASVKYVCAGYEPAAAGQPAHDGTHPGDEDYCWLWALPN